MKKLLELLLQQSQNLELRNILDISLSEYLVKKYVITEKTTDSDIEDFVAGFKRSFLKNFSSGMTNTKSELIDKGEFTEDEICKYENKIYNSSRKIMDKYFEDLKVDLKKGNSE